MHRSQLGGFIIDCQTADLDGAARFWSAALGLPTRASPEGKYIGLETAPNGLAIEVHRHRGSGLLESFTPPCRASRWNGLALV